MSKHITTALRGHQIHVYWCEWSRAWRAYSDTFGADSSPEGTGSTREAALEDLDWQLEELEERKLNT
jgi:hypothetical protein